MIKIGFRPYYSEKTVDKGILYKVNESTSIEFIETQKETKENDIVHIEYCLDGEQYGIYAHEYKRPELKKDGCKTTDVLACIVDENKKVVTSYIFDVKHNISAFSNNLFKEDTVQRAVGEVRDFIKQIHDELLHKKSFMIYYEDAGYTETEHIGIATSSFEPDKFRDVAALLERLLKETSKKVPN